jgi:hypothetical protein
VELRGVLVAVYGHSVLRGGGDDLVFLPMIVSE